MTLSGAAANAPPALAATLAFTQTTMTELMGRLRVVSLNLRPALLDDLGLLPALGWYLDRYTPRTGVQVELRYQGVSGRFPTAVETVAYRIIQETLTNVACHAGVSTATVFLRADDTYLMLRVADAGRGFDVEMALGSRATNGLRGMHERVQMIGGILALVSNALVLPLKHHDSLATILPAPDSFNRRPSTRKPLPYSLNPNECQRLRPLNRG